MQHGALAGWRICVTRAAAQSHNLQNLIQQAGGTPVSMPMLAFAAVGVHSQAAQIQAELSSYHLIFFVSANAAHFGDLALNLSAVKKSARPLPILATVGQSSARALAHLSCVFGDVLIPSDDYSAAGLLADLKARGVDFANWKVLIVNATTGSATMAAQLRQLGARVVVLSCYQLQLPHYSAAQRQQMHAQFASAQIDIITASSAQTLDNLCQCLPNAQVLQTPILPISPKMAAHAQQLGFSQVLKHAQNASDAAIMAALGEYARAHHK